MLNANCIETSFDVWVTFFFWDCESLALLLRFFGYIHSCDSPNWAIYSIIGSKCFSGTYVFKTPSVSFTLSSYARSFETWARGESLLTSSTEIAL